MTSPTILWDSSGVWDVYPTEGFAGGWWCRPWCSTGDLLRFLKRFWKQTCLQKKQRAPFQQSAAVDLLLLLLLLFFQCFLRFLPPPPPPPATKIFRKYHAPSNRLATTREETEETEEREWNFDCINVDSIDISDTQELTGRALNFIQVELISYLHSTD